MNDSRLVRISALLAAICALGYGAPLATQFMFNAYWSTANGFQSLAQLHNNASKASLMVQPVLYSPSGQAMNLDPVTMAPLGNATVDIGAEMAAKGWSQSTTGSAIFQYQGIAGQLEVEIYEGNPEKSISFTIPSSEKPYPAATQDAVFLLPSTNTGIWVSLQNVSNQTIHVTPSVTIGGSANSMAAVTLSPNGSSVLWIWSSQFPAELWHKNAVGGITLSQDGPAGALNTGAWIEDDNIGYSTTLTFVNPQTPGQSLIGTQILVGNAGPALGLPANFVIQSQLVLRNMSGQPADVTGTLMFSDNAGGTFPAQLSTTHLDAGQVISVDLGQIKSQAHVPPQVVCASLSLQYTGASGALMGRVFGTSADGSYGLYWALQPSAGNVYFESFWTTQDDWIPIFTVGNFATTDDQATVLLTSNQGTYTLPVINLKPLESRTINIRELLATAQSFPAGTNFGGFKVSGVSSNGKLMVKEHLISPAAELATPFYGGYQYIVNAYFYENTTDFEDDGSTCCAAAVSVNTGVTLGEQLSGEPNDYQSASPYGSSYGSDNPSIVTLSFSGGAGTLAGVAAGSAGIWATVYGIYDANGDEGEIGTNNTDADVVCAVPTNFQQASGIDSGDGSLRFTYTWGSSTGNTADLADCTIGEVVDYPGGNPYSFPSPPFPVTSVANPTTTSGNATAASLIDNHTTPGTFVTPFPVGTTSFTANQYYRYTCTCSNNGNSVQIYPPIPQTISIVRKVDAISTTQGTFTITKSGVSSSKSVP